jgi:DNA polymerase
MVAKTTKSRNASDFLPERRSLPALAKAARACRGCALYAGATQTVFGEGSAAASIVLIGETPGDQEDRQGRPFVGPAGRLMDEALEQAGIDRNQVYVTNAVKHFKYILRGKRRLHQKPTVIEISACRPWLVAELESVRPKVIVCLGATAAQALLGKQFRLTKEFGNFHVTEWAPYTIATYHPAAVLRAPDEQARHAMHEELFHTLQLSAKKLDADDTQGR